MEPWQRDNAMTQEFLMVVKWCEIDIITILFFVFFLFFVHLISNIIINVINENVKR